MAIRGNPENLGPEVPRHFLSVLSEGDPTPFAQGSGRMELANDIVKQPIAMRVIVNRIWKEHFDTGIVDTPSNFGQKGERPTNPELLEYLAGTFVKDGMSIKKLQRAIMLTQVYQLSTQNNDENYAKDSGNRFYWRANRHRLDAEELRDSVLAVAGNLDSALGGPSEELTPIVPAPHCLREGEPVQAGHVSVRPSISPRRISARRNASPPLFRCSACS